MLSSGDTSTGGGFNGTGKIHNRKPNELEDKLVQALSSSNNEKHVLYPMFHRTRSSGHRKASQSRRRAFFVS